MKIAWATDIHWDKADAAARAEFAEAVREAQPDMLLVTGDISDVGHTSACLTQLVDEVACPIHFVLGNHDYFGKTIDTTRRKTRGLTRVIDRLVYLTDQPITELNSTTALVGHDSWYDARLGNFDDSEVWLADFQEIDDLAGASINRGWLRRRLEALGDEAARHFRKVVPEAFDKYATVVVATHVAPFAEVVHHKGQASEETWLPYFSCKAVGDVLTDIMEGRPNREMLVLCGHTHSPAEMQILDNLRVIVGDAQTGHPRVDRILSFS